jgi:hypothetical protein
MKSLLLFVGIAAVSRFISIKNNPNNQILNCNFSNNNDNKNILLKHRLLIATRIHAGSSSNMAKTIDVLSFIESCQNYASAIVLCISLGDEFENMEYIKLLNERIDHTNLKIPVIIIPISPWGKSFVSALNIALSKALQDDYDLIVYQSLEFRITKNIVEKLVNIITKVNTIFLANISDEILVVGPSLPGHEFKSGLNIIRGRTCPWNTFAIWNTKLLGLTGFPMIGDGHGISKNGGIEEVTTINLLQVINPQHKAILVKIDGVKWQTNFMDPKRVIYHEQKMKSKDERSEFQMKQLGSRIPSGNVFHYDDTIKDKINI